MLWSLVKIILFITLIALLTLGASYLSETSGGVRISVSGTEFNLDPLPAAIAMIGFVVVVWLALKLFALLVATVRFINGDETALSRYFDRNRERRGYEALADGMTALASGEARLAMSKAAKAEKFLRRPDLTNLITAQAAEMSGDRTKAEEAYKRLLADDRTRFVGVRGIMKQKLENGETETAMKLAERAFALKPAHVETGDVLLKLQARQEDWQGARKTLAEKKRQGALPKDVHKRRDAVLALSEAKDVFRNGSTVEAGKAALEANRLSPELIPAAVMAAQTHIAGGKLRNAARLLKKAWQGRQHPDLAAAFASIVPDENPAARIKRFQALTKIDPSQAETKMLLAELHIGAQDYAAARIALGDLTQSQPTARSLSIMAAIERGEGSDDAIVRGWLTKAVTASRGPQWVCETCQTVHGSWAPVCSNCDSFDTMSWALPVEGEVAMPASTEMLPLIVGEPAIDTDETDAADNSDHNADDEPKDRAEDEGAADNAEDMDVGEYVTVPETVDR